LAGSSGEPAGGYDCNGDVSEIDRRCEWNPDERADMLKWIPKFLHRMNR
jgi:hypothetical protein